MGQDKPGLKVRFSSILLVYSLIIGCSKYRENYPTKCFEQKKEKPGLKFSPQDSANQASNNWTLVVK